MASSKPSNSYKSGSAYAIGASLFIAVQEPFSAAAARTITFINFVGVTQLALLISLPLLLLRASSRQDFLRLLGAPQNYFKLGVIFLLGLIGLVLYNIGLAHSHPITISALLNLLPFWAAIVALVVTRKSIPLSPIVFFGCLIVAFSGSMMIAWSQIDGDHRPNISEFAGDIFYHSAAVAIPIPVLTALNGTLIGKWFDKYDTPAAVAANFAVSIVLLIPVCLIVSYSRAELAPLAHALLPVGLLLFGTLLSAALGRALYQVALHVTDNDNGFVTLFFLLVPALSCLIAIPLSYWVSEVHVQINIPFFAGLMVVAIPLLFFCIKSWRADAGASPGARDSTDQGQQEKMAPAE